MSNKMPGRLYQVFQNNIPADGFGDFADIVTLWRSRIPSGQTTPKWSDFEFEDFSNWYGRLSLGEVHSGNKMHMVLWGTQLTDWWGLDHTKKDLNQVQDAYGIDWDSGEGIYVGKLLELNGIGRWIGDLRVADKEVVMIECLDFIMGENDTPQHIFSAYIRREYDYKSQFSLVPEYTL